MRSSGMPAVTKRIELAGDAKDVERDPEPVARYLEIDWLYLMVSDILSFMGKNKKYQADDLVAVVWLHQSGPNVLAGEMTWEEAAREAWAMDADKADRVKVLIGVFRDVIQGAWLVTGATHQVEVPEGKTRMVNRSWFEIAEDPDLAYLVNASSPWPSRRNPQTTFELRDLPGADRLIDPAQSATHGLVHLGHFALLVSEEGRAELRMPPGAVLTVRTAE
jgi:hypothetical protein